MKVAIAQLNYTIGDFGGNAEKIIHQINKAKLPLEIFKLSTSV